MWSTQSFAVVNSRQNEFVDAYMLHRVVDTITNIARTVWFEISNVRSALSQIGSIEVSSAMEHCLLNSNFISLNMFENFSTVPILLFLGHEVNIWSIDDSSRVCIKHRVKNMWLYGWGLRTNQNWEFRLRDNFLCWVGLLFQFANISKYNAP